MDKLKPCPYCGKSKIFQDYEKTGLLYGYGIGCVNTPCMNHKLLIRYGFNKDRTMKRAIKAWNRRSVDALL